MGGHVRILSGAALALALLTGCGNDDGTAVSAATSTANVPAGSATEPAEVTSPATGPSAALSGAVTVFAAASLSAAFTAAETAFEALHPGVDVVTNFAASSELATQISEGAPADVFASADLANMAELTDAGGTAGEPVVFATNLLEIVVEQGNPLGITGVADLADPDLILTICAPEVPCGGYAATIFENAGVTPEPDSLEENVKAVVTKVTAGEADAGIAYTTDVLAVDDLADGVAIPADQNVIAEYPIALTREAPNPEAGQAFIDFLTGPEGQAILAAAGFTAP